MHINEETGLKRERGPRTTRVSRPTGVLETSYPIDGIPESQLGIEDADGPLMDANVVQPVHTQTCIDGLSSNAPTLTPLPQKHTIVDSQYIPRTHLIINNEGDPWTVDYYQQFLGLNDEAQPQALGTAAPNQSYRLIRRFILKVMQTIDPSQDTESLSFSSTGSAGVFSGLVPHIGDMFIADVGTGIAGLFTITRVQRMAPTLEACHNVDYEMVCALDDVRLQDLERKTIERFTYVPELIELLDNPFLTDSDYTALVGLNELDSELRGSYARRFWSRDLGTFGVPQMGEGVYDAWHTRFISDIGLADSVYYEANDYRNGTLGTEDVQTVWDAILEMSDRDLPYMTQKLGVVPTGTFRSLPVLRSVAWSRFSETVYPSEFDYPDETIPRPEVSSLSIREGEAYAPIGSPDAVQPRSGGSKVLFNDVGCDSGYYVFSKAFYEGDLAKCSLLEWALRGMLAGRAIDSDIVQTLGTYIRKQPKLLQFYYVPVILTLIHYCRRGSDRL